jgi:uncharacterized protein (DUF1684 family)
MHDYHAEITRWRAERDRFFGEHYASPLSDEVIATFEGLDYFEIDERLVFSAVVRPESAATIGIDSSTGSVSHYPIAGVVDVPFPDGVVSLLALQGEEDEAFIPFRDVTCGLDSYGAGRYVSINIESDGSCIVDFNRAINPYCAYDPEFSCPLPPRGNWLERPIAAGEKDFDPKPTLA